MSDEGALQNELETAFGGGALDYLRAKLDPLLQAGAGRTASPSGPF
jgi:hypothetical protein